MAIKKAEAKTMNKFLAKLRKGAVNQIGFKAQANGGELELQVYDVIGQDFFGEGITVKNFSDAIDAAGDYNTITCHINSPGGDVFESVAIYNLLRNQGKPVNCVVEGVAASAASIVAMAGDKVTMGEGAMMMIHNAMAMVFANANEMREMADVLDTVSGSIADIYAANTGLPKADIRKMMDAETWMSAADCVKNGFADAAEPDEDDTKAVSARFDLSVYNKVPAGLKNRLSHTKEVDGEALSPEDFIYVGDPEKTATWSLPWHFSTEEKTQSHLRDALARFDQDQVIPPADRPAAHAKLVRLAKEHGIEVAGAKPTAEASAAITAEVDPLISLHRKRIEIMRARG